MAAADTRISSSPTGKPLAQNGTFDLAEHTVLVIDDSEAVRTALDILLSMQGARVVSAPNASAGLDALARDPVDLVIQDMNFRREATSGEEGIALFRRIRSQHPQLPIILLTAWTHLETAVELVKAGASDYLAKPWDNTRLLTTVRNLLELEATRAENRAIRHRRATTRAQLAERFDLRGLVYESEAMHALAATAARIAHADVPVLITGPNGAGKEVMADIVQANSAVKSGPYVKVNVGALPDTLMEAELFGTEAGAFTGAKARIGRFEAADGGTIFLDELGNLSAQGQAKLLRVLQTGEYERLGSNSTRRTQVRIIAATNAALPQLIKDGRFREDLLYRLNVIELDVPPLSGRPEDILPLAQHFLEPGFNLAADAQRALTRYRWPGNVRELKNVIHRACLLAADPSISAAGLALPSAIDPGDGSDIDRRSIEQALSQSNGVIARAARDLGLSRQALYRRMEKLGLKTAATPDDGPQTR
ncbi:MAG: sigma-54 dependent transcriptional regulator [Steroidobacteraceae bacterium]